MRCKRELMDNVWVMAPLILILAGLLGLALVFRAMGRQVRKDYRSGRRAKTKSYDQLAVNFAYASAFLILYVGLIRHEWFVSLAFGSFTLGISLTVWLNKPKASQD